MQLKAFTLIELIMVVVVLGMMAIFVYPNYTKTVDKSYEKAGTNNLYVVYAAQRLFYNNSNPPSYAITSNGTAAVNNNLQLSIVDPNMAYTCTSAPAGCDGVGTPCTTYACTATKAGAFQLKVTQIDPASVCCCNAAIGVCPSVANCTALQGVC